MLIAEVSPPNAGQNSLAALLSHLWSADACSAVFYAASPLLCYACTCLHHSALLGALISWPTFPQHYMNDGMQGGAIRASRLTLPCCLPSSQPPLQMLWKAFTTCWSGVADPAAVLPDSALMLQRLGCLADPVKSRLHHPSLQTPVRIPASHPCLLRLLGSSSPC